MSNRMEIVFVLDRSGSMGGTESDIVGGFNSMIAQHREQEGGALVSTVLFSDESRVLHDRVPIDRIPEMKREDYRVGGCTALLDAVGGAICHIRNVHKYAREEDRPQKTLFVVMTDGCENASREYSNEQIKRLVKQQEETGWEFLFIGADIDAFASARGIGVRTGRAVNFSKGKDTFSDCFAAVGKVMYRVAAMPAQEALADDEVRELFQAFGEKR